MAGSLQSNLLKRAVRTRWTDVPCSSFATSTTTFPLKADVVVCGAGLAGLSVAHRLAERGANVCVFDRDCVGGSGASSLSIGLMSTSSFWPDGASQKVVSRSQSIYAKLAKQYRFEISKCGRVYLAASDESVLHAKQMHSRLRVSSKDAELIDDPSEMLSRWPMLSTEDIRLALTSPSDEVVDTGGLLRALASEIKRAGGRIFENTAVQKVLVGDEQKVYAVMTDQGLVETQNFVNAAGIWSNLVRSPDVAQKTRIAIHPCSYSFLTTGKLPHSSLSSMTPVIVDLEHSCFFRITDYHTLCGGFHESDVVALVPPSAVQSDWVIPTADWDRFYPVLKHALFRCTTLGQIEHGELICSAESYTPDGYPIIGETEQVGGYFVINGFNGKGLPYAGGLGEGLADWILEKQPKTDVHRVDVTRFLSLHSNPQYLHERVPEVAANTFVRPHHTHQCHTARNLRMSSVYHQLRNAGAVFGEIMGYERPLWFTSNTDPTRNALYGGRDNLVGKPIWFPHVAKEYEACRERVGLIDMTSFAKFEVGGPGVVEFLQKICSANIDRPVGTTIYTGMQNEHGGYVTDCTMSRIAENKYFIIAPTIQQLRCPMWLRKWIREWEASVYVNDVTGMFTALNVVGPASRYLMQDVTGLTLTASEFPSFAYREINIGMATGIRAISVTHCGELGWVLYIPNEVAQNVYEQLVAAGQEYSLMHAGYYCLRHLRIEKLYVYWGQDINSLVSPLECGRAFRVDFSKEFIGRKALMGQSERGITKRFVQLLVDRHDLEHDPWPQGNEVVYRNGVPCGYTTSAAYGFTLGCHVCIGVIENEEFGVSPEFINNGSYEVDISDQRFPARISVRSPSLPMVSSEHPHHYRPTQ